jgi:hypothetical protein
MGCQAGFSLESLNPAFSTEFYLLELLLVCLK